MTRPQSNQDGKQRRDTGPTRATRMAWLREDETICAVLANPAYQSMPLAFLLESAWHAAMTARYDRAARYHDACERARQMVSDPDAYAAICRALRILLPARWIDTSPTETPAGSQEVARK